MNLLRRRKPEKMGVRESSIVRSDGHLKFVRGFCCAILDKAGHQCSGKMHAHHCREGADGGTGMKPGDDTAVPLCDLAHAEIHAKGWQTFEAKYGVDLSALATRLWKASAHRLKWEKNR